MRNKSLTWTNQDIELGLEVDKTLIAWSWIGLSLRRDTIPNKDNCRLCRAAWPGREPDKKKIKASGVLGSNFWRFWRVFL